ncbi:hypothetical protein PA598K_06570 [Paenibacillus sp. 598K]|uniref:four-carbon acid sugar kinase family protein n=1 Tax=Paenibacillus sp. 598K TaxID=1117987 RepID=UPI000FFA3016|nr:four-carbon acid sugar kinase family protein [Paenibacillus sp. 598K]GBF77982.1 hypothetical protein PA598K_06570 [Paenibacillus sp. 598K]
MKLAIIADDLTGANDSGVQLAAHGLSTAVLFDMDEDGAKRYEAVVYDTDSRAVSRETAYERVEAAARFLVQADFVNVFKKMDSTMRGNIGAEIDAVYDVLQPDFVMFAPGYPKNNRTVAGSTLYLKGVPVGETEIARDPKTPVTVSYLPELLGQQTSRAVGTITVDDLAQGQAHVLAKLAQYSEREIAIVVVDSTEEQHLEQILSYVKQAPYTFVWAGSAGLANYLPAYYDLPTRPGQVDIAPNDGPILTVIGSVNKNSRAQLKQLLDKADAIGIPLDSAQAVASSEAQAAEVERVYLRALGLAQEGKDVVLYSTGEPEHIAAAQRIGEARGWTATEVSNEIVKALGAVCAPLLEQGYFTGVSMSGGDTAKQICERWGIKGFELQGELEIGVPISTFLGKEDLYVVTKAGGFGTEDVFIHAIQRLKGAVHA